MVQTKYKYITVEIGCMFENNNNAKENGPTGQPPTDFSKIVHNLLPLQCKLAPGARIRILLVFKF